MGIIEKTKNLNNRVEKKLVKKYFFIKMYKKCLEFQAKTYGNLIITQGNEQNEHTKKITLII